MNIFSLSIVFLFKAPSSKSNRTFTITWSHWTSMDSRKRQYQKYRWELWENQSFKLDATSRWSLVSLFFVSLSLYFFGGKISMEMGKICWTSQFSFTYCPSFPSMVLMNNQINAMEWSSVWLSNGRDHLSLVLIWFECVKSIDHANRIDMEKEQTMTIHRFESIENLSLLQNQYSFWIYR